LAEQQDWNKRLNREEHEEQEELTKHVAALAWSRARYAEARPSLRFITQGALAPFVFFVVQSLDLAFSVFSVFPVAQSGPLIRLS
jgi:hypothetical protein